MNRADFKRLANLRIREAKVLLDKGFYAGAFYLAGYAVECALKACIAKQTHRHDFPPDLETVRKIYTHDFGDLLKRAGLSADHIAETKANRQFEYNWSVVKDWSEQKRYEYRITKVRTQSLYDAIVDPTNGVLTWLKRYW